MATNYEFDFEQQRATLSKLNAEITKIAAETARLNQEYADNAPRRQAELEKMAAETAKLQREAKWYPAIPLLASFVALLVAAAALYKGGHT